MKYTFKHISSLLLLLLLGSFASTEICGQENSEFVPQKSIQPTSYQVVSCMSSTFKTNSAQLNFTVGEVFVGAGDSEESSLALFEGFQYPTVIFSSAHRLFANLFLEGPYQSSGTMNSLLGASGLLPLNQPFNEAPYYYEGSESIGEAGVDMVDWILIEARTGVPSLSGSKGTTTIETRAGMLLSDGTVIGADATEGIAFYNLEDGLPYHFCVRHRNHLDVLTATPILANSNMNIDFTTSTEQAFGAEQLKLSVDNVPVLFAGDFNQDGIIQTTDYDYWSVEPALNQVYWLTDGNLDGVVQSTDYDVWFFNKAKVGSIEIGY